MFQEKGVRRDEYQPLRALDVTSHVITKIRTVVLGDGVRTERCPVMRFSEFMFMKTGTPNHCFRKLKTLSDSFLIVLCYVCNPRGPVSSHTRTVRHSRPTPTFLVSDPGSFGPFLDTRTNMKRWGIVGTTHRSPDPPGPDVY